MRKLNKQDVGFLIDAIKSGKEIPQVYKYVLFPTMQKEYELVYAGKKRKEDVLADDEESKAVPLQVEKILNGTKYRVDSKKWHNLLVFGDNLQILKTFYRNEDPIVKDKIKGKVKLMYIDPPFAGEEDFSTEQGQKAYRDKKKGADFVEFLRRRLLVARELLADNGSIFVHLDYKKSHYIKVLLDEIFGENNLINEIIWAYTGPGSRQMKQFNRKHDTIFWYSKTQNWTFNKDDVRVPYADPNQSLRSAFDSGEGWDEEDLTELRKRGKIPEDWWELAVAARLRIDGIERTGYPTEKPNKLLERIIRAASNKGDLVMDFFAGSGAFLFMSEKLERRWVGCDVGKFAIYTLESTMKCTFGTE